MKDSAMMIWIVLMGVATGMRTMTAVAVLCWAARLGLIHLESTWAFWMASTVSVIVFTLLAVGEYVGDVLPQTPPRTAPGPLVARLLFGAVACGAAMTSIGQPLAGGVVFGLIGALIGAYGGMAARMSLSRLLKRDWPVGLAESALALAICVYAAHELHVTIIFQRLHT